MYRNTTLEGGGGGYEIMSRAPKKPVTEDCLVLDITKILQDNPHFMHYDSGVIQLEPHIPGGRIPSVKYKLVDGPRDAFIELDYYVNNHQVSYPIRLQETYPHFGGNRWWLTCPLVREENPCGNRVGKLYLPPEQKYFGCRSCYNLTYLSTQKPYAKRLDDLRKTLEVFQDDLESTDPQECKLAARRVKLIVGNFFESSRTGSTHLS